MLQKEEVVDIQLCENRHHRLCEWKQRDWWLRSRWILATCALFLFGAIASAVLAAPQWSFNGTRLIPSYLLAYGHKAVSLHGNGPLYSTHYGPLTYVFYLPATLFHTPNAAVLAGSTLTISLCLLSIGWLHFGGGRWRKDFWCALLGFTTAGYLICYLEPLRYSCVNIHADGPAIALGGAACALLRHRDLWSRRWAMIASATLVVSSALCKQPMALLALGLVAYLLRVHGRAVAIAYVKALCVTGVILGAVCIWVFGPSELYYNLLIAARQPWHLTGLAAIIQPLRTLIRMMFPVLLLAMAAWVSTFQQGPWKSQLLSGFRSNDWMMLFVAGFALLPSSLAGFAKAGGDINSLSFSSFFFTVGVTCMLADLASGSWRQEVRRTARGCLLAMTLLLAIVEFPGALPRRVHALETAEQQVAFDYLRSHSHTTFFPWFPLPHLLAEGRFYHWSYGIIDRVLAGEVVSPEYFRAHAPAKMETIAFGKDGAREILGIDLLAFWGAGDPCTRRDPDLASWEVYGSSASACLVTAGTNRFAQSSKQLPPVDRRRPGGRRLPADAPASN